MILNDNMMNENKVIFKNRPNYMNSPLLTNKSEISCETSSLSSKGFSIKDRTNNNSTTSTNKNRNTSLTLSISSSSSSTKTTLSSSSSLESLDFENSLNYDQIHVSAPYYMKKFYGKEWLFQKLHEYLINKTYEKSIFLLLIGDSGNGKTHLCCELKWPTNEVNSYLKDLNKHIISTYFISLYNIVQCSHYKNLQRLYSHLKNTILKELSSLIDIKEIPVNSFLSTKSVNKNLDDDEDADESDENDSKNDIEEYNDHIINKYASKFNENVVNVLNNYSNEIQKLNKNFYILIDGIDELLLYDQYLMGKNKTNKFNNTDDNNHSDQNFNIIFKFLNKIFLKFPKWLHLVVTCKRITEKQCVRNKYFNNIKNYFKLSIDTCVTLNNAYLNILNENDKNSQQNIETVKSNYSLVSYLTTPTTISNQQQTPTVTSDSKIVNNNNNVISSSSSSSKSSSSPSSSESRLTSSSFGGEKQDLKNVPQTQVSESSAYSTSSSTHNTINSNSILTMTKTVSSAEILNAAHFASLKDIQIYILKRLDNDNELKLKFNKLNAIEMLNLLLIKSNNCLLYVEKVLDLILSNIINSREIRDIPVTIYGLYLFLIERLLTDLESGAADFLHGQQGNQPEIQKLIYSIFNLFIVELKPLSKLKLYLKLKLRYHTLDYNYYEYIFNAITPILFTKSPINATRKQTIMKNQEHILFHSSLIEWFSDVKFCTNKYLSNLSEGHFILTLFFLTKFQKQFNLNDQNTQINYRKNKKLPKLFKKFQFHLINSNKIMTRVEYNYILNLCESSTSLQLNYDVIKNFLSNYNYNSDSFSHENSRNSVCNFNNNYPLNNNNNDDENLHESYANNDNNLTVFSNPNSIHPQFNMCGSGLDMNTTDINNTVQILLFNFVINGDLNGLKLLVNKGFDIEMTDSLNQTPLILAAKSNKYEIIEFLCKIPTINLDHCDKEGWTALRFCSWIGNEKAVKRLIESHATVDASDSNGRTALRAAVYGNHENIMKLLIKNGANINKCDKEGRSILQIACYKGHWNIISYLSKFESLINHKDHTGRNSLFTCIYTQNKTHCLDIMKLLIINGCEIDEPDNNNQTVLILAVQEQLIDVVNLLIIHGADIDANDNFGYTAITHAIKIKNVELVEYLLSKNAATHILDLEGRSILSIACSTGFEEAVRLFMVKGLDEMHKDNFGWTPLHEAAYLGSILIVDMLLQYGSDINDIDNEGKNALYYACQEGHLGVVKLLIMRNASFDYQSHDGNTPFRIACLQSHKHVCEYLISINNEINNVDSDERNTLYCMILLNRSLDMIEFLLRHGANINQKDTNGRSCLHIAAHIGNADVVSLLIKYNGDIELEDNGGRTPLLTAIWNDNIEITKLLLEAEANINHQDEQGATALSIATQKGNYDLVLELLTNGSLIYASSKNPIQIALKCEFHNIEKLLENWAIKTEQKPPIVPRSSKSLDSFRLQSKITERRIISTIAASSNKKEKLKNSQSMSYQHHNNNFQLNNKTSESYCVSNINPVVVSTNNASKPQSSLKNFLLRRSATSAEKNKEKQSSVAINSNNIIESTITNSPSEQSTPLSSPATKSKNSNNKFFQMIRKKFKFLKLNTNNNDSPNNENKHRKMHRSITDSIAHKKNQSDDTAFIFNRTSINDYLNQRTSIKEFNNELLLSSDKKILTNNKTENTKRCSELNSNNISNHLLNKRPTCLPLNYFKKETSI